MIQLTKIKYKAFKYLPFKPNFRNKLTILITYVALFVAVEQHGDDERANREGCRDRYDGLLS